MTALDQVLAHLDADRQPALERYFDLLRIPSISTDPAFVADCERAAEALAQELRDLGFDAAARPTPGRPMVVGHHTAAGPDRPHVLFYAHYDVQPVDPLSEWRNPPFEPRLAMTADGVEVVLARGASDDKGNLRTFFEACRAWIAETGGLPINVTVLLEGEEESGSPSLIPFLTENRAELTSDLALICDTGLWDRQTPNIPMTLRGMVAEEIVLTAAATDLHSGGYGPVARNPNHLLVRILSQLHDETGRVTLPGFYDGVTPVPEELMAEWRTLGFDEAAFLANIGLSIPAGEPGYSFLELLWARPTCEVNGMTGGYTGDGFKTVIPARASAKVSFRLVGDQDPGKVRDAFRAFVADRVPADCSVTFIGHSFSPPVAIPFDHPLGLKAAEALGAEWGRACRRTGSGGSIPVVGRIREILGMDSVGIGFALKSDRIHAPNEQYDLASFRKGARAWARILEAMSR